METDSPTGDSPAAISTSVIDLVEEDFENVYDVPFITVNRIDGQYVAEVMLSGNERTDEVRIQTALDVGFGLGHHSYARVHSDREYEGADDSVLIYFTPDSIPDDISGMWPR